MTPKEKAFLLVNQYKGFIYNDGTDEFIHRQPYLAAKQCAIICVDEIQSVITRHDSEYVWNYWKQVKTEIEKL